MNLARVLVELPPSLRWRWGRLVSAVLYRRAFAAFGSGSVIVAPIRLRGVERIRVGAGLAAFERCWIEAEGQATLVIGDRVYLGHGAHVHAVDDVKIGDRVMLADNVLVNSGAHAADELKTISGRGAISIGNDVFVGQNAVILGGVTIGERAIIGAGAVVTRDVPAGATAVGVPARVIGDGS